MNKKAFVGSMIVYVAGLLTLMAAYPKQAPVADFHPLPQVNMPEDKCILPHPYQSAPCTPTPSSPGE